MATQIKSTAKSSLKSTPKKAAARKPKPAAAVSKAVKAPALKAQAPQAQATSEPTILLNHDQIAAKAYEIWQAKGRPIGQDVANWQEALATLG